MSARGRHLTMTIYVCIYSIKSFCFDFPLKEMPICPVCVSRLSYHLNLNHPGISLSPCQQDRNLFLPSASHINMIAMTIMRMMAMKWVKTNLNDLCRFPFIVWFPFRKMSLYLYKTHMLSRTHVQMTTIHESTLKRTHTIMHTQ